MRLRRTVRIVFYGGWGLAGGIVFIADLGALLMHPRPIVVTIEAAFAALFATVPYLVWRLGGGYALYRRDGERLSLIDVSIAAYAFAQRSKFAMSCTFAALTVTTAVVRAVASLQASHH